MAAVSLGAIVTEYRDRKLKAELATDWGSVVFYRVPAFLLAFLLAPLGITPNTVTVVGALLIPAIALAAWFLDPAQAIVVITILGLAFNVLDCTDGVLARALNLSSVTGRYIDFAADILFRITTYASLGLVADRMWPGAAFPWLAVGLCCGLLSVYARVNRLFADELFQDEAAQDQPPEPPVVETGKKRSALGIAFSVLSGLDTLLPLIAFLAWQGGLLREALVWFLIYTAGDSVLEVEANYRRARRLDARG